MYVPFDVHVGSVAVQRFIEDKQPLITLQGYKHESARIMGSWQEKPGEIYFLAAHDGNELALVRFNSKNPKALLY